MLVVIKACSINGGFLNIFGCDDFWGKNHSLVLALSSIYNVLVVPMNQRIRYALVSTDDQHLDLQRDALTQAGCIVFYEETVSGKSAERTELEHCRKALREGDTLVVWRLERLGLSLPDLLQIATDLEQRGVGFESLTEKIETSSAAGKLVFHVFASLAEFERGLICDRAQAGLAAARARGRSGGRKPKLGKKDVREIKALLKSPDIKVADVARRYGVSRTTLYKHVGVVTPNKREE